MIQAKDETRETTPSPASERKTLLLHAAMSAGVGFSLWGVFPQTQFLLKKTFHASNWETLAATSAIGVFCLLSVPWVSLYRRTRPSRYALLFASAAVLPMFFIGWCGTAWSVVVLFAAAAFGYSAQWPLSADIFRRGYSKTSRGRAYGWVGAAQLVASMAGIWAFGRLQEQDERAYTLLFPAAAAAGLAAMAAAAVLARRLCDAAWEKQRGRKTPETGFVRQVFDTFHRDRTFFRFEMIFMIYGAGWMLCAALLPAVVTERMGLGYEGIAAYAQVSVQCGLLAGLPLIGRLADHWGPARLCAWSFLGLVVYPAGLLWARNGTELAAACVLFGLSLSGVFTAWNIGPVTFAPVSGKAPLYAGVHTSMVGVRSLLFQPLGVLLYSATGTFTVPLLLAVACFLGGSAGMFILSRRRRRRRRRPAVSTAADKAAAVSPPEVFPTISVAPPAAALVSLPRKEEEKETAKARSAPDAAPDAAPAKPPGIEEPREKKRSPRRAVGVRGQR